MSEIMKLRHKASEQQSIIEMRITQYQIEIRRGRDAQAEDARQQAKEEFNTLLDTLQIFASKIDQLQEEEPDSPFDMLFGRGSSGGGGSTLN